MQRKRWKTTVSMAAKESEYDRHFGDLLSNTTETSEMVLLYYMLQ